MDLVLHKGWTNASGKTDKTGRFPVRGFQETYEITINVAGLIQTREIILPPKGMTVTFSY